MAIRAARLPVAKTCKIYIGGKFPRTESGRHYELRDRHGKVIANICRSSRKDFRNAVVAARTAQAGWASASAYLRGQILYRIAEMLEGRRDQFIAELVVQGVAKRPAAREVDTAIDRLVYYAGWADKTQGATLPINGDYFCYTRREPVGVLDD